MADIIKMAEQLNSDVTRLNNERSKLEGMLESAKTNYEKAVQAYEVKYGVKLTEETLQAEYNDVFARTKGAILDLQEKIESIKRGDYKKDVEDVEYDLEPEVEPIRAEVKPEPEKKKRGRKPKAEKVETPVEVAPVETPVVEAEDIDSSVVDVEDEVVIPDMGETPFKMDLTFDGFGDNTTIEIPKEEPKKEEPKKEDKPKSTRGRKPLTAADLSAAVTAAETVKQTPVTMPTDDEDDEVDLSGMDLGVSFGEKPAKGVTPTEEKQDFGFGSFGDLGGFGGFGDIPTSNPVKEEPKVAPKKEEPVGFDFGGFGGFGGLDNSEDIEDVDDIEDVEDTTDETSGIPSDGGFSFGGLGDLGVTPTETKKPEKKDAPITPEGWGADVGFGDFGDFGSILNSDDFKFGE